VIASLSIGHEIVRSLSLRRRHDLRDPLLVWRYFRHGGGWKTLKMMDAPTEPATNGEHAPNPPSA
jgi:hypothetical protein